jgi:NAD(P)-dependent dehydrogenase (short-subunit alcohol dehydrogenase family)
MATGAKAAIVTGAASGLGRAMALGLADSGIDVVAVDQNAAALGALATAMAGRRGSVLTHPADLTHPDAFEGIAAAAQERFGRIDILVNNAGIGQASVRADQRRNPIRFWEATPEQWTCSAEGLVVRSAWGALYDCLRKRPEARICRMRPLQTRQRRRRP